MASSDKAGIVSIRQSGTDSVTNLVNIVTHTDLPSTSMTRMFEDLLNRLEVNGTESNMDILYYIPYMLRNDHVLSRLTVTVPDYLRSKVSMKLVNEVLATVLAKLPDDIQSIVEVNVPADILSRISINITEDLIAEATVVVSEYVIAYLQVSLIEQDTSAKVTVNPITFVNSLVKVPISVEMDITTDIFQPPVETLIITPVQDTYVREARPLVPYGLTQGLVVGNLPEGELRSFLDFDLTSMNTLSSMNIEKIVLSIDKVDSIAAEFSIHETYSTWVEATALWASNISFDPVPLVNVEVFSGESFVTVDFTSLILQKVSVSDLEFNISLISIFGYLQMFSRESSSPPKLIVYYTDPNWVGNLDKMETLARLTIKEAARDNIQGYVSLAKHLQQEAVAEVKYPGILPSGVKVTRRHTMGNVTPVLSDYLPMASVIRQSKVTDLSALVNNPNQIVTSAARIGYNNDITSKFSIEERDNSYINAQLGINRPFLQSFLSVVKSTLMPASVSVAESGVDEIPVMAKVIKSYLPGTAHPVTSTDVVSKAIVRESDLVDVGAVLDVNKDNLASVVYPRLSTDLVMNAFIKAPVNDYKPSVFFITKPNLQAQVAIVVYDSKPAKIFIREHDNIPSIVEVQPSNSKLAGTIGVREAEFLQAVVTIQRTASKSLPSTVTVRRSDTEEVVSSVVIREITVLPGAASIKEVSDFAMKLIVRQIGNDHLACHVIPVPDYIIKDIPAKVQKRVIRDYQSGKVIVESYIENLPDQSSQAPKKWWT